MPLTETKVISFNIPEKYIEDLKAFSEVSLLPIGEVVKTAILNAYMTTLVVKTGKYKQGVLKKSFISRLKKYNKEKKDDGKQINLTARLPLPVIDFLKSYSVDNSTGFFITYIILYDLLNYENF